MTPPCCPHTLFIIHKTGCGVSVNIVKNKRDGSISWWKKDRWWFSSIVLVYYCNYCTVIKILIKINTMFHFDKKKNHFLSTFFKITAKIVNIHIPKKQLRKNPVHYNGGVKTIRSLGQTDCRIRSFGSGVKRSRAEFVWVWGKKKKKKNSNKLEFNNEM